jgi:hypothetical protein
VRPDPGADGVLYAQVAPWPGTGLTSYPLPVPLQDVQRLEVDAHGHVWLAADSQLWCMAGPRPVYAYLPIIFK